MEISGESKRYFINADTLLMLAKSRQSAFLMLFLLAFFSSFHLQAAVLSSDPADESLVKRNEQAESFQKNEGGVAKIIDVSGEVKILKGGTDEWLTAAEGDFIETGDQIITGTAGSVDIALDAYLLNITHISENTKAEFRSLKPTDIYMEDGSIYSALDGLASDEGYQIATPTAVAAVRGTHFEVGFDGTTKKFSATAVPTDDPEHQSRVLIHAAGQPVSSGVEIIDGKELSLQMGQRPEQKFIRQADPAKIREARAFLPRVGDRIQDFHARRQEGKVHFRERQQPLKDPTASAQGRVPGEGTGQRNLNGQNSIPNPENINDQARQDKGPGELNGFRGSERRLPESAQAKGISERQNFFRDDRRKPQINPPQNGFQPRQNPPTGQQPRGNLKGNEGRPAGPPPKKQ